MYIKNLLRLAVFVPLFFIGGISQVSAAPPTDYETIPGGYTSYVIGNSVNNNSSSVRNVIYYNEDCVTPSITEGGGGAYHTLVFSYSSCSPGFRDFVTCGYPTPTTCATNHTQTGTGTFGFNINDNLELYNSDEAQDELDIFTGDIYSLTTEFPELDEDLEATVQPDPRFYVRFVYTKPSDVEFSEVRFNINACHNEDCSENELLGTGTLDMLENAMETGKIYFPVPVVNGETRGYSATLTDPNATELYAGTAFKLIGDPEALIAPEDALSGTYQQVPNPLTNPTGFIEAVIHNIGVTIFSWVLPPENYFWNKFQEVQTTWATNQPGLTVVNAAFSDGITSLSTPGSFSPITIGSMEFNGGSTDPVVFFDPESFDPGIFEQAKTLISACMYFGVCIWVIREMSTILSA